MNRRQPLPWLDRLWTTLQASRRDGRLSHALLLGGPAGVGKRHFAGALAASLLCEALPQNGIACGSCRGCVQFAAGSHPNLHWLQPEVDDKSGREKRDISVEQLRNLLEKLQLSSHYGGAKVAVLAPADALNASGVNGLLKTIEEPPPATYLMLISERPMALAATLRSRCLRLQFPVPPETQARAWLATECPGIEAGPDALREAFGAPLQLARWAQSGALERNRKWRDELLAVALRGREPLAAAAAVGRDRDEVQAWLSCALVLFGDLLRDRATGREDPRTGGLAHRIGSEALEQLIAEAVESSRRLQTNAQPQLVVESLMIAWWRWARMAQAPRRREEGQ